MEEEVFYSLSNLVELDLSNNQFKSVPREALKNAPSLRRLSLNNNPIKRIQNGDFSDLINLYFLDLSSCSINVIMPYAFHGLSSVRTLKLNDNHLRSLSGKILDSMLEVQELNLQNNPWKCDCNLRSLREKMIKRRIPLSFDPTCSLDMAPADDGGDHDRGRYQTPRFDDRHRDSGEDNDNNHHYDDDGNDDDKILASAYLDHDKQSNWQRLGHQPWSNLSLDEFACSPKILMQSSHQSPPSTDHNNNNDDYNRNRDDPNYLSYSSTSSGYNLIKGTAGKSCNLRFLLLLLLNFLISLSFSSLRAKFALNNKRWALN